jgi:hypothetical protein
MATIENPTEAGRIYEFFGVTKWGSYDTERHKPGASVDHDRRLGHVVDRTLIRQCQSRLFSENAR